MYYASTHIQHPKHKKVVTLVTTDGETFEGSFFVSGDQRIKDLLNGDTEFLPFETLSGVLHLLNRSAIARVIPHPEREPTARSGQQANVA